MKDLSTRLSSAGSESPLSQSQRGILWSFWSYRTDTLILVAGFLCTACAKGVFLFASHPSNLGLGLLHVLIPDILFFSGVYIQLWILYCAWPSRWMARGMLVVSVLVSSWSLFNAGWLLCSGVQLQSGIVVVLVRDLKDVWPLIQVHIRLHMVMFGMVILGFGVVVIFLVWRMICPPPIRMGYRQWIRNLLSTVCLIALSLLSRPFVNAQSGLGFTGEILGFSSHWNALVSILPGHQQPQTNGISGRQIPKTGTRRITPPQPPKGSWPNVVMVFLESVSYKVVPPGNPRDAQMPFLAQLAREGVEFACTRVPVPRTTKTYWNSLTGCTPILQSDYVEAVPVDTPYESLATILSRVGYRSAFFEMSKGTFECAPGLFSNLGFDWAWFRENLEDSSAHIGYLGGDDLRLIGPATEWAAATKAPFLLVVITSISHDPYLVPPSFEPPASDPFERYLQTVRYTDLFLRTLYGALREKGLAENLLICVQGDHGTSLGVDRDVARWRPREEVIRVPWVIRWPGHIQPGMVVEGSCSQLDTTPTVLGLLGFDVSQAGFDGLNVLASPPPEDRAVYFSSWYDDSPIGLVHGSRKLVYWPYYDEVLSYDLATDLDEMSPVPLTGTEKESIKTELLRWMERSQIHMDAKRQTQRFLYNHWQAFSAGRKSWAYYVP